MEETIIKFQRLDKDHIIIADADDKVLISVEHRRLGSPQDVYHWEKQDYRCEFENRWAKGKRQKRCYCPNHSGFTNLLGEKILATLKETDVWKEF